MTTEEADSEAETLTRRPSPTGSFRAARLRWALSSLLALEAGTFRPTDPPFLFVVDPQMGDERILQAIANVFPGIDERVWRDLLETNVWPVRQAMARIGKAARFAVAFGDDRPLPSVPAFYRTRPVLNPVNVVLGPLGLRRLYDNADKVRLHDVPWEAKADRLVWRGATTGKFEDPRDAGIRGPRAFIPFALSRITDPRIDIGYSAVVQGADTKGPPEQGERVRAAVKGPLGLAEQLRAKYLLALEGNDLASGLRWMMASNSLVLMPHPRYECWGGEGLMQPFKQYVPVRRDLADLEGKLAWCRQNDAACRTIAMGGKAFVAQSSDEAEDREIFDEIVEEYVKRVRLV